jgi:hypothetical protein
MYPIRVSVSNGVEKRGDKMVWKDELIEVLLKYWSVFFS